jgi:Ca-activated chloride channel family protein
MTASLRLLAASAACIALAATPLLAHWDDPPPPEEEAVPFEEENDASNVIVTGTRVRQGGAQDIRHFRSMAAEVGMPRPESLTVEGLMGEHDLALPATSACDRLFCLVTEAMAANLPSRPQDRLFAGLGFTSNLDATSWKREPLNLVAVVDKSGSMSGPPLDLVRASLRQIVGQMREEDQLSIVLYGDMSHLYLPPTPISGGREKVLQAIDAIESAGSTNMEAGLRVGYDTAFASAPAFRGATRLMLFTDEQPNTGNTDPESFIGMAEEASRRKIGLTTIGVGVQFDGALAAKVSSARGGNLFFISDEAEVKRVFEKQLDTMVTELAHDVRITMKPRSGYRISGVFGVPDNIMEEGSDGSVSIMVPTAFLSTNGGGIFASLAKGSERENLPPARLKAGEPLMEVWLSYLDARSGAAGSDRLNVGSPSQQPSAPLRLAHLLVDEYFSLRGASAAFHREGKPRQAFALLSGFSKRLEASAAAGLWTAPEKLGEERKLVKDMLAQAALYSGYGGEQPRPIRHLMVIGDWEVQSVSGMEDLRRGDRLSFSPDNELTTMPQGRDEDEEEIEDFEINERQLRLPDTGLVFDYRATADRLTLRDTKKQAALTLRRIEKQPGR